jgi:putative transposase
VPQSLSLVILHLVFSTKQRFPFLKGDIRPRTHAYLAALCRDLGGECFKAGGTKDHVHIAATLPRTLSQAQMLESIKKKSSKWLHGLGDPMLRKFKWQAGYASFSVSPSKLNALLEYIENQEEHHRQVTFQEEYRQLLRRHNVPFDERWMWD